MSRAGVVVAKYAVRVVDLNSIGFVLAADFNDSAIRVGLER